MLSPLSRNTKIALATALVIMGCLLSCFAARGSYGGGAPSHRGRIGRAAPLPLLVVLVVRLLL